MNMRQEYEIITFDEFKSRNDGGGYLLYWQGTEKYYFGRSATYKLRHHESTIDRDDIYLNRHWKKHGAPDVVVAVPLVKGLCKPFEKAWLDIFRNGPLYDKSVCMNTSGRADCSFDCMTTEQRVAAGRRRGELTKKHGRGIFGLTSEQQSINAKLGYKNSIGKLTVTQRKENYKNSLGKLTTEQRRANGKKGVVKQRRLGIGVFGRTPEQHRNHGLSIRKLTRLQVHDIRHLLALGDMPQKEIAEHFPVGIGIISNINTGKTYADW